MGPEQGSLTPREQPALKEEGPAAAAQSTKAAPHSTHAPVSSRCHTHRAPIPQLKASPPPKSRWCRVATIAEALQLARPAIAAGQLRGVMIETKQPTYHDRHNLPLEQKLVNELVNASYGALPSGSVILESFELQVCLVRDWCSFAPLSCLLRDGSVLAGCSLAASSWMFQIGQQGPAHSQGRLSLDTLQ